MSIIDIPCVDNGFLVVGYLIGFAYTFICCAVLTEDYFVPALERLAKKWQLPPDVAGATLMAVGSSAPEISVNILDTIFGEADLGLDSVIGSALFNVCIITSFSAFASPQPMAISPRPFLRDFFFYLISILWLSIAVSDYVIYCHEAIIFLVIYFIYVMVLLNNERFNHCLDMICGHSPKGTLDAISLDHGHFEILEPEAPTPSLSHQQIELAPTPAMYFSPHPSTDQVPLTSDVAGGNKLPESESFDGHFEDDVDSQHSISEKVMHVLVCPIETIFGLTIPQHYLYPCFGMSIVWVMIISYILIQLTKLSGCALGINLVIMGIVFLADGTSIPDMLCSITVAKQMKGDMAISNISGSNISNCLIGLGLPWSIQTVLDGKPHDVSTERLLFFVVFLSVTQFASLLGFWCEGFVLTRRLGCVLVFIYILFLAFTVFVIDTE